MKKTTKEPKKRPFFKKSPTELGKLLSGVSDKLLTPPFSLLTSKKNKIYSELIVKECGVTEIAVKKILLDSFNPGSIVFEVCGDDPAMAGPGEALFKGYAKAIEALQKTAKQRAITEDKTYRGVSYGRGNISLQEALLDDIEELKKKQARWAGLYTVHLELRKEYVPRTIRRMIENQAFCLFQYIDNCFRATGDPAMAKNVHDFISELFMVIYDHPAFNAVEKFTPKKIKEYCDNGKRYRKMQESLIRKSIESL